MKEYRTMRSILTAAFLAIASTAAYANDPFAGDLTEPQLNAITMVTVAVFAGSHNTCPRFHVIERATLEELRDGGVTPAMLDTTEYQSAYAAAAQGAIERQQANPADFCSTVWQLFGPHGQYGRQMLEAN
jgi:hypothetical protein